MIIQELNMKRFYIIILIFSVFVFSCYQSPDTSSSTGSVSINLSAVTKAAEAAGEVYDGELRLAVYSDGALDSYIKQTPFNITYLAELPSPLLANNSVPYTGASGVVTLLNVPADTKLNLFVEHYGADYYINDIAQYYLSYAGKSESFEVGAGENTDVSVSLVETVYATEIIVTNKGTLTESANFRIISAEDYNQYISISGSTIDLTAFPTSYILDKGNGIVGENLTYTGTEEPLLPGKKLRLIISETPFIGSGNDVGVSGTFELQPGLSKSLAVTYYSCSSSTSFC